MRRLLDSWFAYKDRAHGRIRCARLSRAHYRRNPAAVAWTRILAEIAECEVVCANCHRRGTARDFKWRKLAGLEGLHLPALPARGIPGYERLKSRRSPLVRRHRTRAALAYLANCHRHRGRDRYWVDSTPVTEIPRLNGVIRALEAGQPAFVTFAPSTTETAMAIADAPYDGVVFEMEHNPYDIRTLRDCLQYLLSRRQIVEGGTLAPAVTPLVRIPPNGGELNQWVAKQVLDSGVYGVIWPHVSSVEEARNAVAACRYPRPQDAPRYQPAGQRGDAPAAAARYWGLTQQEYYRAADVWPLASDGEIMVVIMCEDTRGVSNLPQMLEQVPGIGAVLIGEGDLSQELGVPRQYEHPKVVAAMNQVLATCARYNVACGHPHVTSANVEHVLAQGFRWLMPAPVRSFAALEQGLKAAGRRS